MVKVIIADDEPMILMGIRKLADWEDLGASIVAQAEDGEELLEKIEKYEPDIVVLDVAMPGMSGIDVMKKVRDREQQPEMIFMSGYQEFAYVQDAIKYDAVDYLLKPVVAEDLENAVRKAKMRLKKGSVEELLQKEKNLDAIFQSINEEDGTDDVYRHFKSLDIRLDGRSLAGVCFMLSPDSIRRIDDTSRFELLKFAIFKRIQELLQEKKLGFPVKRDDNSSNMILSLPQEDTEKILLDIVNDVRKCIWKEYGAELIVGIGSVTTDIRGLRYVYKTAKFSAELHFFMEKEIIWFRDVDREYKNSFEEAEEAEGLLKRSILNDDGGWRSLEERELEIIENLHFGNRKAAENKVVSMLMNLQKELSRYHIFSESEQGGAFYEALETVQESMTWREMKEAALCCTEFLVEVAGSRGIKSKIVQKVMDYVDIHFQEDISLSQIAGLVFMNPYYFSAYFKKETGKNFKNYLREVRMEKALKLLMESDITTQELARAVGYKDYKAFVGKFRETYGESPSSYRKSHEKR